MSNLLRKYKEVYDSIHGYIKISYLASLIIDTPQFQRLRYLHQLGTCHYVFPTASHTRFEHSIGTYHLTGKVLDILKLNSEPDFINDGLKKIKYLKSYYETNPTQSMLDPYVCELIKIAALCHDIGHGPFSHVFDDIFLKHFNQDHLTYHENRSCMIIRYIIKNNELLNTTINEDQISFICSLINPSKEETGFIFQIISNNLNSIDVDKFDYICRDTHTLGLKYSIDIPRLIDDMAVIDNKICFLEKLNYELVSLFKTRYRLHKQIYCHKAVVSIQYMVCDIMLLLNDFMNLDQSIYDVARFSDLTEEYIITYLKILFKNKEQYNNTQKAKIVLANNIWNRIINRDLYKLAVGKVTEKEIDNNDLDEVLKSIDKDKIICYKSKIGFVSGSKGNPMDETFFYKKDDNSKCFRITDEHISLLVPKIYQEYIYMFFLKDKRDIETKKELIKVWNEKLKY